jgi:hypothetical protein
VKLILDEMYPQSIAEQLRGRGHDAEAVVEHADRRSYPRSDPRLVGRMVTALDRLLGEHPDTVAEGQRHWL